MLLHASYDFLWAINSEKILRHAQTSFNKKDSSIDKLRNNRKNHTYWPQNRQYCTPARQLKPRPIYVFDVNPNLQAHGKYCGQNIHKPPSLSQHYYANEVKRAANIWWQRASEQRVEIKTKQWMVVMQWLPAAYNNDFALCTRRLASPVKPTNSYIFM